MKNKKALIFSIVALVIILGLAYKYFELMQNYISLKRQVRYEITSHLGSSISFAAGIDLNKVGIGDKNSVLNMLYMYEDISDLDATLTTISYGEIALIDPLIMYDYKIVLREIILKSMQGQLTPGDINNIVVITDDIKQINKYVTENTELNSKRFIKELEPKLKIYQVKQDK